MDPLPHRYTATAIGSADGDVALLAEGLPTLRSASPAEFGGPGDRWSPETLIVAAVADCFVLTFRAVAQASSLAWTTMHCEVEGRLDRVDRVTRFTRLDVRVRLYLPPEVDEERAQRVLQKAKQGCLITNSLNAETHLESSVFFGSDVPAYSGA
ncbi:MAG TPA: OsmC family protein [Vicinamibacterales bacterium]|nr:OsmC family protein [Vicinamibacterales bacterium]